MARSEDGKQYRKEKRKKEIMRMRKRTQKKARLRSHRDDNQETLRVPSSNGVSK